MPAFPDVPAEFRQCFDRIVSKPAAGKMSSRQIAVLIRDLQRSEIEKSACGKRLLAWVDANAAAYAPTRR